MIDSSISNIFIGNKKSRDVKSLGLRVRGLGGEIESNMNKKEILTFLKEKMQEIYKLETLPPNNIEFPTWCNEIEMFLHKILGKDSIEYETFKEAGILRGLVEDARTQYRKALKSRETALVSIIKTHEKLRDEEPLEKRKLVLPIELFDAMHFHPKVIEASRGLFKDEHYSDAILRAFIAVCVFVKEKSRSSLDGKSLMSSAFNEEKPLIKINDLLTQSDRDEQEGFKFLYMGSQVGIRNPKAHDNIIQRDPHRTLEYLSLASLLMKRVEEGKAVKL